MIQDQHPPDCDCAACYEVASLMDYICDRLDDGAEPIVLAWAITHACTVADVDGRIEVSFLDVDNRGAIH